MFGFVIGALSAVGFFKVLRWERGWRHHGGPREWMLRALFERLNTSPEQEKVLSEAASDFETSLRSVKNAGKGARTALAEILRAEHFDQAALSTLFDSQQQALEDVKKSLREGLTSIHATLVPEQRRRFAQLVEHGPGRGRNGRSGCCRRRPQSAAL